MKKLLPSVNCKKNHYISCIDMVSLQCKFFDEHEDYLFTDDNIGRDCGNTDSIRKSLMEEDEKLEN